MKLYNNSTRYCFPLCVQMAVPMDLEDKAFNETLEILQKKGFYGVELNILDFDKKPEQLKSKLSEYGLVLTQVASGGYAKKMGLSLSSSNEEIRHKTVLELKKILSYAEEMSAGVICGFIKGNASDDFETSRVQMEKSLFQLFEEGDLDKTPLYLEATNHYEARMVNRLEEGVAFSKKVENKIWVLPDTYHMNIEEKSMLGALAKYSSYYSNIHISDNNRYFPGFGALNFYEILRFLKEIGYNGTITFEGRNKGTLNEDIVKSADYIEQIGTLL